MEFRTEVGIPSPAQRLSLAQRVLCVGSCFASEIGRHLQRNAFLAEVNPLGVMFNPLSVAGSIVRLADYVEKGTRFEAGELFENQGLWRSWDASSRLAGSTKDEALLKLNSALERAASIVAGIDVLVMTLGTTHVYFLDGRPVANCHKMAGGMFEERAVEVGECVDVLHCAIKRLQQFRPGVRVVLTVSPYRYAKYGFHENTLSKAALHLAIAELQKRMPEQAEYFPAYEIVLDELRDYRFFAPDMLHPSQQAIDYIWQRFTRTQIADEECRFIERWQHVLARLDHRSLAGCAAGIDAGLEQEIKKIQTEFPQVECDLLSLARRIATANC